VNSVKPNLRFLGKKLGPKMRFVVAAINFLGTRSNCKKSERNGKINVDLEGEGFGCCWRSADFFLKDIPGWSVASWRGVPVSFWSDVWRGVEARPRNRSVWSTDPESSKRQVWKFKTRSKSNLADDNDLGQCWQFAGFGTYIEPENPSGKLGAFE